MAIQHVDSGTAENVPYKRYRARCPCTAITDIMITITEVAWPGLYIILAARRGALVRTNDSTLERSLPVRKTLC
jgi:hypothetical protein